MGSNVAGSSGQLTRRQYYAAHGRFEKCPTWFKHAVTGNKPAAPSTAGLTSDELAQFQQWQQLRENGTLHPGFLSGLMPNVQTLVSTYETYYASSAYIAWSHDDLISREHQWRLRNADVLEAIETGATLPVSADPTGAGANAPVSPITASVAGGAPTGNTFDTTGAGSITIPDGASQVVIEYWAAGEGGARGSATVKGGGAGGYGKKTVALVAADWGTTISYNVGAGGAGRTASTGNGAAGADTTVSTFTVTAGVIAAMRAKAGGGVTPRIGGVAGTGGDINTPGGNGSTFLGGASPYGGAVSDEGDAGNAPGGGGGGGLDADSENGGNGAAGRVKFTWSY
jgi:hypothetical protein